MVLRWVDGDTGAKALEHVESPRSAHRLEKTLYERSKLIERRREEGEARTDYEVKRSVACEPGTMPSEYITSSPSTSCCTGPRGTRHLCEALGWADARCVSARSRSRGSARSPKWPQWAAWSPGDHQQILKANRADPTIDFGSSTTVGGSAKMVTPPADYCSPTPACATWPGLAFRLVAAGRHGTSSASSTTACSRRSKAQEGTREREDRSSVARLDVWKT
jgi:hypothetical protein